MSFNIEVSQDGQEATIRIGDEELSIRAVLDFADEPCGICVSTTAERLDVSRSGDDASEVNLYPMSYDNGGHARGLTRGKTAEEYEG